MEKWFNDLTLAVGTLGGGLISLLGGSDSTLKTLLFIMALDYITGLVNNLVFKGEGFDYHKGLKGILTKIGMLLVISLGVMLENVIQLEIRSYIIMFFIANEGLSVLQNVKAYVTLPPKLKQILESLLEEGGRK